MGRLTFPDQQQDLQNAANLTLAPACDCGIKSFPALGSRSEETGTGKLFERGSVDIKTVLISAIAGVVTSAATAYLTTRLKMKEERKKWDRDLELKYAEAVAADRGMAESLARQFAVGFVVFRGSEGRGNRVFVPRGGKLRIGRDPSCEIVVDDASISREAALIEARDSSVFLVDLFHTNGCFLNGVRLEGGSRSKLSSGDVITVGRNIDLIFQAMEGNR
jgi:hypothetical protein